MTILTLSGFNSPQSIRFNTTPDSSTVSRTASRQASLKLSLLDSFENAYATSQTPEQRALSDAEMLQNSSLMKMYQWASSNTFRKRENPSTPSFPRVTPQRRKLKPEEWAQVASDYENDPSPSAEKAKKTYSFNGQRRTGKEIKQKLRRKKQ